MRYDIEVCANSHGAIPTDQRQRDYLLSRINEIRSKYDEDLRKKFGLRNDNPPLTSKEIVERITTGKFVLSKDVEDSRCYNSLDYFIWRDPDVKRDQPGFNEANKLLSKRFQDCKDAIMISEPKDGLAILQDFETASIQ